MRATGAQVRERPAVSPARIPAAASTWAAARLGGPAREVTVIGSGPHAVYLAIDDEAIALLARAAVQVPVGLNTDLPSLPTSGTAKVGNGQLRLGPLLVRAARLVDPHVPRLPGLAARGRAWAAALPMSLPVVLSDALPTSALQSLAAADTCAVGQLIGRGAGLTPLGDDVLAAWLVSRSAAGLDHGGVDNAVLAATGRTTMLSATLLLRALAGEAVPQLRDLLIAVGTGVGPEQLRCQLDELLAVGHTSGAGLALGAALALNPALDRCNA